VLRCLQTGHSYFMYVYSHFTFLDYPHISVGVTWHLKLKYLQLHLIPRNFEAYIF